MRMKTESEIYEELENKLQKEADKLEIPNRIQPKEIQEMLKFEQKRRKKSRMKRGVAFAASLALFVGSFGIYQLGRNHNETDQRGNFFQESKESEISRNEKKQVIPGKKTTIGNYTLAKNYDDIMGYMISNDTPKDSANNDGISENILEDVAGAESTGTFDMSNESEKKEANDEAQYSKTNTMVEAIDEADIVKTDGKSIFLCKNNKVVIVDIADGSMKALSEISPNYHVSKMENLTIHEMFLDQSRLLMIYTVEEVPEVPEGKKKYSEICYDIAYIRNKCVTYAESFDVSDVKNPKYLGKIQQEGFYKTSRKTENDVYLFTDFAQNGIDDSLDKEEKIEMAIPKINGKKIDPKNYYLPKSSKKATSNSLVITSFSMLDITTLKDEMAVLNQFAQIYMSENSVYMYETDWSENSGEETTITKFHYEDGKLDAVGSTKIKGSINEEFGLFEKKDHLRVLATELDDKYEPKNALYIFDEKMNAIGKIKNIAPGEDIYAARFIGEMVYFVTYRNMDPLFAVDLSNEAKPEIVGYLKITGYSDYLHPFEEGKMIGIGYETDPETSETLGVKLSMFDISDPKNIKVLDSVILQDATWTQAAYEYKSVLVDASKNLIGFSYEVEKEMDEYEYQYFQKYALYQWNGKKFERARNQKLGENVENTRSMYVDNYLFVLSQKYSTQEADNNSHPWTIISYDMNHAFEKLHKITL